jgi:predicted glutamine amidotransferase
MCVIAAKPAGVPWLKEQYMKNCFKNNSDGAGIAWVQEGKLHIKKGYFNWNPLWKDLKCLEQYPVLLHCRQATHGSKTGKNCHPFLLENGLAMAHNGIIDIDLLEEDMTDSESFGRRYLEQFTIRQIKLQGIKSLLEMAIGSSKIAMLSRDGEFIILNEAYGVVHEGLWFSNHSYKNKPVYNFTLEPNFFYGEYSAPKIKAQEDSLYDEDDFGFLEKDDPFYASGDYRDYLKNCALLRAA